MLLPHSMLPFSEGLLKIPRAWARPPPPPHRGSGPTQDCCFPGVGDGAGLVPQPCLGVGPALRRTLRAPALPSQDRGSAGGGLPWSQAPGSSASPEGRANTGALGTHGGLFPGSSFRRLLPQASPFPEAPYLLPSPGNPQPQRPV